MIYSPYATSVTRKHQNGERLADIQPDPANRKPRITRHTYRRITGLDG